MKTATIGIIAAIQFSAAAALSQPAPEPPQGAGLEEWDMRRMTRFLLTVTLAIAASSVAASAQPLPPWAQWLLTSGHLIEDGRACGLVGSDEVDGLYAAVLAVSGVVDGIAADRAAKALRIVRDHARDEPVTQQTCQEAKTYLPELRGVLTPYMRAAKSTR